MSAAAPLYDHLATLLTYPAGVSGRALAADPGLPDAEATGADALLRRFADEIRDYSATELEELYTRTFDLNPVCCLEVGWHLFGEDYNRGRFLVRMREQLRRLRLSESGELPDHLTDVLRALGRLAPEEAARFAAEAVLPALDKMLTGFPDAANPYAHLLEAVRQVVAHRHGHAATPDATAASQPGTGAGGRGARPARPRTSLGEPSAGRPPDRTRAGGENGNDGSADLFTDTPEAHHG